MQLRIIDLEYESSKIIQENANKYKQLEECECTVSLSQKLNKKQKICNRKGRSSCC